MKIVFSVYQYDVTFILSNRNSPVGKEAQMNIVYFKK